MAQAPSSFRQKLINGDNLVGTFLKTPTSHATEIIGGLGFDFVIIDQFIGRGDLTAAFGDELKDPPRVREAVERISAAARKAGKPISVYVGGDAEAEWLKSLGASMFVLSSDQGFLRQAAAQGLSSIRKVVGAA